MALRDRIDEVSPQTTDHFECPQYETSPGTRRCSRYLEGGGCSIPGTDRCLEWARANAHRSAQSTGESEGTCEAGAGNHERQRIAKDLFGKPLPPPPTTQPSEPPAPLALKPEPEPQLEPPIVRNLTDDDIASFKALGASVRIRSEHVGDVWLVPEYTGKDRQELSIEHAATLTAICAAFPGAKVTSFEPEAVDSDEVPQE